MVGGRLVCRAPGHEGAHANGVMTLGKGAMMDVCQKHKCNAQSSTEAEMIGADNCIGKMIWTKHFLEGQGYSTTTILHQDNMSSIKLEENGKRSSTKRTRHLNINFSMSLTKLSRGG